MAMIRKRGKSWQGAVRRKGHPLQIQSFKEKIDAQLWARKIEYQMDSGSWVDICTTIV
jgi:hypothetical protein